MTPTERRVIKAAMALYRHWVRIGRGQTRPNEWCEPGHWYPLCSERQAKAFGKACAALPIREGGKGEGK